MRKMDKDQSSIAIGNSLESKGQNIGKRTMPAIINLTILAMIYAMGIITLFLIFCEPDPESTDWIKDILMSKAGAVIMGGITWYTYKYFFGNERDDYWQ